MREISEVCGGGGERYEPVSDDPFGEGGGRGRDEGRDGEEGGEAEGFRDLSEAERLWAAKGRKMSAVGENGVEGSSLDRECRLAKSQSDRWWRFAREQPVPFELVCTRFGADDVAKDGFERRRGSSNPVRGHRQRSSSA